MSFFEVVRIALLDLRLHKFRAALATLGIIFGVASVEAMVSISEGARRQALDRIAALGIDNLLARSVKPSAGDRKEPPVGRQFEAVYGLKRRDLEHIRASFGGVVHAVGLRDMRQNLYAPSGRQTELRVMATEPAYLEVTRSAVERGRFLAFMDQVRHNRVCVLGVGAARDLFQYADPLGAFVRIGSDWYRVVGILENRAAIKAAGGDDINRCVFIPLATARARYGDVSTQREAGSYTRLRIELDAIAVRMAGSGLVIPTGRRLAGYLGKVHPQRDWELMIPLEILKQKEATQRIFTIVMLSIAGISLLVGGIGIMNIMLANVYDRRKEIGTRRALGARRIDIMRQFVIEAATLTSLGGFAGALAGYGLAHGVSRFAGWPTEITASSVLLGLCVSTLVGILFGMWPARQAARVNPIEALRSE